MKLERRSIRYTAAQKYHNLLQYLVNRFTYELIRYALKTYLQTKNELFTSILSKVIALHTCEQTDMLTVTVVDLGKPRHVCSID